MPRATPTSVDNGDSATSSLSLSFPIHQMGDCPPSEECIPQAIALVLQTQEKLTQRQDVRLEGCKGQASGSRPGGSLPPSQVFFLVVNGCLGNQRL